MRNPSGKKISHRLAGLVCLCLLACLLLAGCTPITWRLPSSTSSRSSVNTPPTTQESQIARAVFAAINRDRVAAQLLPLQWSDALARSARQHNNAMMAANQLAHQLPGEADPGKREQQQGVSWLIAAENIGVTNDLSEHGALSLHQAMMAERPPDDGHRQNILNPQLNHLGIDVLFDSVHGKLWLTEDFSRVDTGG